MPNLETLSLYNTDLGYLPNLRNLALSGLNLDSIKPVTLLKELRYLTILDPDYDDTHVTDLNFLRGLDQLQFLEMDVRVMLA